MKLLTISAHFIAPGVTYARPDAHHGPIRDSHRDLTRDNGPHTDTGARSRSACSNLEVHYDGAHTEPRT